MRTKTIYSIALSLPLLFGCSIFPQDKVYQDYAISPLKYNNNTEGPKLIAAIEKTQGNPDGLVNGECLDFPIRDGDNGERRLASCQRQRNIAIMALLTESDNTCQAHVKTIFGNEASFNIATGTITNLASGAAAIAGGPGAKSALSGIAFLSNAERSLVNETVYKNVIITAVTKKISETRSNIRASITGKFGLDANNYSILDSVNDIIGYHQTCSFMYGLQKALDEGSQPSSESRKIKLEKDKHDLEIYVQTRAILIGKSASEKDVGINGARARITAIEEELLSMIKGQK